MKKWIAIWIGVFVLGFLVGGCMQTIHGMASDMRATATYVEDHTIDDK